MRRTFRVRRNENLFQLEQPLCVSHLINDWSITCKRTRVSRDAPCVWNLSTPS